MLYLWFIVKGYFISPNFTRYNYTGTGEKCRQRPSCEVIFPSGIDKMPNSAVLFTNSYIQGNFDVSCPHECSLAPTIMLVKETLLQRYTD